jgi:CheY-like chemotaxis protein
MIDLEDLIIETQKLTLLYVEDNDDNRLTALSLFEDLFQNIVIAVDGQDGLQKFQENKIDIILTDINMPNMDGLKMAKKIKQLDSEIPIIILTAISDISTVQEAINIGIDSFINKPLDDINTLFSKLNNIVQKMHYVENLKEKKQIKQDKEKVHLVFEVINNISHHWKQPLSVITTISSGSILKQELGMEFTKEDFENYKIIIEQVQELSNILKKLEDLDLDTVTLNDLEKIISISNPIYKD